MRIHITGNAGAGKTTLAKAIGDQLGLPVYGLDKIVWQPGWRKTPAAERDRQEAGLVAKPEWVIEGVSHCVRRAADVTVFLDVAPSRCFARCIKRSIPFLLTGRPELPADCPEYKILPRLLKIVWRFNNRVKPVILEDIAGGLEAIRLDDANDFSVDQLLELQERYL